MALDVMVILDWVEAATGVSWVKRPVEVTVCRCC
jgi:hypothetical protein